MHQKRKRIAIALLCVLLITSFATIHYKWLLVLINSRRDLVSTLDDDVKTTVVYNNRDKNNNKKKYIFNLGSAGLNNYLLSLSSLYWVAKRYNRTLLIHPCPHNDHTHTESFTISKRKKNNVHFDRGRTLKNNAYACTESTEFTKLFTIPFDDDDDADAVRYEIASVSHPIWDGGTTVEGCGDGDDLMTHQASIENIWREYDECMNRLKEHEYVYFANTMYMGASLMFDFSPMVYDMVKSAFQRKNLALNDTVVIHLRLGDWYDYCTQSNKPDCYFTLQEMESKIREMRQKLSLTNVVIMSNGKMPVDMISRNNWTMISDIYSHRSLDSNLQIVVEMATGVLAQYFVGNVYSTLSGSITALRKRRHYPAKRTTTIGELMGRTDTSAYTRMVWRKSSQFINNEGYSDREAMT